MHACVRACVSVHVWCMYACLYISTFTLNPITWLTGKLETTPGTWLHACLASLAQNHCVGRHSGPAEQLCVFQSPANICTYIHKQQHSMYWQLQLHHVGDTHCTCTLLHSKLYGHTVQWRSRRYWAVLCCMYTEVCDSSKLPFTVCHSLWMCRWEWRHDPQTLPHHPQTHTWHKSESGTEKYAVAIKVDCSASSDVTPECSAVRSPWQLVHARVSSFLSWPPV